MKTEKIIKSETVEKLDKSRYFAMKWLTISYSLLYCPFIAHYLMGNMGIDKFYQMYINLPILHIGTILFQVFVVRFVIIMRRINSNSQYKQILNDEYYASTTSKSFQNAFVSILFLLCGLILVTTIYPSFRAILVFHITLFIGAISGMISWLVYNR